MVQRVRGWSGRPIYSLFVPGGGPGEQTWAETLALGNPSGGTDPVISLGDQLQYVWTGPDSQLADNRLDPANDILTLAFDLPFFVELANLTGGGAKIVLIELLKPATGNSQSQAIVEATTTFRFVNGGAANPQQGFLRGAYQSDTAAPIIENYEINGLGSSLSVESTAGNLELAYTDDTPADQARVHGVVRVAASSS